MATDASSAAQQVRRCPRNAQCRLDLALAHEANGELRRALAEVRCATSLVPRYGRAWKTQNRLEATLADAGIPTDDADALYLLVPPVDDEEEEETAEEETTSGRRTERNGDASRSRVGASLDETDAAAVEAYAAERKADGNARFQRQQYDDAIAEYSKAIDALRRAGLAVDAKLLSNRAAAYLQLRRHVNAATDARAAVDRDPQWWKGHWYLGQALLAIVRASPRGACTANAERAQEALRALSACLSCDTLPGQKRDAVERLKGDTQDKVYEMCNQEACCLQ